MKITFVMFAVAGILISFALNSKANPVDGLVLHLSFDNETIQANTVKDQSGTGNDGVIHGGARTVAGKYGEAMAFDGRDDFVEVPLTDSITFSTGDSLTVQAWIKTEDQPPQNDVIVGNYRYSTAAHWTLGFHGDHSVDRGKTTFSVRDKGRVNSAQIMSPDVLNDGEWHVLAGVRDQNVKKIRFYVDGELIGEFIDRTQDINSGQSIWVGEVLNRYYKGLIDEVKVWNRPLTAEELKRSQLQPSLQATSQVNLSFTMPIEVRVGEAFTVTLNITDAVDLAGVEFDLHFNPTVLEVTDIQEGDLLAGTGTFFQVLHLATVPGEISGIRIARIGGVDGSGTLLKVVFKAKGVGVSELATRNLRVGTSAGTAIPANVVSGKVEVGSRPDVTGDGKVNILDLVLVSRHFGPAAAAPPGVDINGDGEVNILDIIVLAQHLSTSNTSAAPTLLVEQTRLDAVKVQGWLSAAYVENDGSLAFARGIANLEALLARIVPTETAVYANYPNPFNPETWLPYQIADAANVTFRIYSASGHLVRTLGLGHQAAGLYQSRSRAAYWDGRDALGEPVASGVYFYTLMAGDFTATRKMLIRK